MRGRDQFARFKPLIQMLTNYYKLFPMKSRERALIRHRAMRGKAGMAVRYAILRSIARECGDNVAIYEDVYFYNTKNLRIGSNVSIHPMSYIQCGKTAEDGLTIGNDVSIAHGVTIMSTTHPFENVDVPIKDLPTITEKITIGNDVWIGAKVSVLSGVQVADGCVIGANAVVTKSTEPRKVYAGVPARVIKER